MPDADREYLSENAGQYVALTRGGDVITAWQDEDGDWHAIRPVTEDDGRWDELPEHVHRSLAVRTNGDPETADLACILWTDSDSHALADVAAERRTHDARGWTARHDDEHGVHHLAALAVERARPGRFHPTGYYERTQLVKATALLLAAIDTLDRAEASR